MASVNIDFKAYEDARFKLLGKFTGRTWRDALATCSQVWKHCLDTQNYFISPEMIDALVEHDGFAEAMVRAQLATGESNEEHPEPVPAGTVRVKGTKGRVEWLEQARAKQAKATAAAKAKRVQEQGEARQPTLGGPFGAGEKGDSSLQGPVEGSNGGSSSFFFPPSSSSSFPSSGSSPELGAAVGEPPATPKAGKAGEKVRREPKPRPAPKTAPLWDAYCLAYRAKKRVDFDPPDNGRIRGMMGALMARIPADDCPSVIEFFMTHPSAYYAQRGHDFGCLVADAEKLWAEWKTGNVGTRQEAARGERRHDLKKTWGSVLQKAAGGHDGKR